MLYFIKAQGYARNGRSVSRFSNSDDQGIVFDVNKLDCYQCTSFWLFSSVYVVFNFGAVIALRAAVILPIKEHLKQIKDAPAIQNTFWAVVIIGGIYMGLYLMFDIAITAVRHTVFINFMIHIPWQYVLFDAISYAVPSMCIGYHGYLAYTRAKFLLPYNNKSVRYILSKKPTVCCTKNNSRCVAVWILLSLAQLLATSLIPVLVSILIDTIRTIAILMLVFSMAVCLVFCLALAFKILDDWKPNMDIQEQKNMDIQEQENMDIQEQENVDTQEQENVPREKLITLGVLCTFGAVICVVLAVYILVLTDGGMKTLKSFPTTYVYALLPSALFSAIGIGIKHFFFSKESGMGLECLVEEGEERETDESVEPDTVYRLFEALNQKENKSEKAL